MVSASLGDGEGSGCTHVMRVQPRIPTRKEAHKPDTPFSDFLPITHGRYNVTKSHDPWVIQRCTTPMTYGLYNIVQPMGHGELITHGS